jgi:perosamine synthetase
MLGLIPVENWEYHFVDIFKNLYSILFKKQDKYFNIVGLDNCIPIRSARAAIVIALKALDLPAGSYVGVPLYCCHVVFKAIIDAGFKPLYMDIDPQTYCISLDNLYAKRSQMSALIAVHMFGNVCNMNELKTIAGDIPIIEDCAQSLGTKYNGQITGTFGDISAFSFRSGKYLAVGEGGALYSINQKLNSRLLDLVEELPTPDLKEEVMHIAKTYLRSKLRSKPFYGPIGHPLWRIYNKNVEYNEKAAIDLGKIFRSDLTTTNRRLISLDKAIERQRTNAEFFSRTLELDSNMLCSEPQGSFYNRFLYPILFDSNEECEFMASYLLKCGIDTSRPYKDMPEVSAKYYGYNGDCPVTEQIAKKILAIPSHHSLTKKEVQYIAKYVNNGLKK